jgi:AraC-like DNA-binding protein
VARAYLEEHQTEDVFLRDVARAARLSPFYFCKTFHRETGLTFLDYLARLRVESVKARLFDPHVRISEAAFAAGFQSLSQFNRVFRRIVGEAPTRFRGRWRGAMPAGAAPSPRLVPGAESRRIPA